MLTIAKNLDIATDVLVLSHHIHVANWSFELDEWVGAVVVIAWQSLARSAEISVAADCALVAHAVNVRLIALAAAERPIAVDSKVANHGSNLLVADRLVQCCEPVAWVSVASTLDTVVAVV